MGVFGTINLSFGDGNYDFCVAKYKEIFELQDKCGIDGIGDNGERIRIPAGPQEIFVRLRTARWRVNDYRETIRLGLIGGGMSNGDALKMIARHVDGTPFAEHVELATHILAAALVGPPGDQVGKPSAEGTKSEPEASGSSAPRPTAPVPPSASRPAKSTKSRHGNSQPA